MHATVEPTSLKPVSFKAEYTTKIFLIFQIRKGRKSNLGDFLKEIRGLGELELGVFVLQL